jgi:hypothetical protein
MITINKRLALRLTAAYVPQIIAYSRMILREKICMWHRGMKDS